MSDLMIIQENIQAVGPIYEAAILEEMKAFAVADRLLELFQNGLLPIRGAAGDLLFKHWKASSAALPTVARRRLLARAVGLPGGNDADPAPNREFGDLFLRFVSSVSAFARQLRPDAVMTEARPVTQEQVRKAARDLAVNLSLHGFGMTGVAATELQQQIVDLIGLLSNPEIRRAYGARDVAQFVDRVAALELGGAPKHRNYLGRAKSGATVLAWLARRAAALPASGDILDVADIKGRRPSDNPRSKPTDYDLVNACELWLADTGVPHATVDSFARPRSSPEVRQAVRSLLSKSAAYARLSPAMQSRISRDTALVVDALVAGHTNVLTGVAFPKFVTELVTGVFNAIVDASMQQMEAYADLVAAVAASVDKFLDENVSDESLRTHLCDVFPPLCDPPTREEERRLAAALDALAGGTFRRLAKSRQQLLATMVMLGVNRCVASNK